jgi:hypothetical protein
MNKEQFIFWLKGFTKAVNEEGPTPKQWETIVSELDKIKDCPDYSSPIGEGGWSIPNLAPIQTFPFIQPYNPYIVTCEENPYKAGKTDTKVTYGSGTTSGSGVIVTDGFIQNSSITRAQPPFTLTTTSTAYGYPSGSTVNYTANLPEDL